jgi:hypothetical protein
MLVLPNKEVCPECVSEYQKIFSSPSPLFDAFKRGWSTAEKEEGLPPLEIPKSIQDYYRYLPISPEQGTKHAPHEFSWAQKFRKIKESERKDISESES